MSLDLLNELEKRVQSAVSTIEDLKQEIEQLKDENAALTSEKDAWEGRLAELLGKFDLIDSAESETSDGAADFSAEAISAEESSDLSEDDALNEDLQEETLANQAFEQDFADATEESDQSNNTGHHSF